MSNNRLKAKVLYTLVFTLFLLLLSSCSNTSTNTPTSNTIKIASWNIRILSNNSRDNNELDKITQVLTNFDLVAIQEVKDIIVLDRIKENLTGWKYIASPKVGTARSKEIYAFLWNANKVSLIDSGLINDTNNIFIREPFSATFKSGEFDFTLCTIHLLYGNRVSERRQELIYMDEVFELVQNANGLEQDVLLMGDFNFSPTDKGWDMQRLGCSALFHPPTITTLGKNGHLYDNIWLQPSYVSEYTGQIGVIEFDQDIYQGDLKTARLEVSDHRPIWAVFDTTQDDDSDEYGSLMGMSVGE